MPRQQSWLTDAYSASKTRAPMPPSMLGGGLTQSSPPPTGGISTRAPAMPSLGYGVPSAAKPAGASSLVPGAPPAPATSSFPSIMTGGMGTPGAAVGGPTMDDLLSALRARHIGADAGAPPPTSPSTPTTEPAAPPLVTTPAPGGVPPPGPGTPGYVGPGPVSSSAQSPGRYDSPEQAQQAFLNDIATNPKGWQAWGLHNTTAPGAAGLGWLSYILADPYNRMISDSAEKQTLENTNTAFDAARGKMKSDALQAGAGQSGVAQGRSAGLELARGQTQAKNVRDFEQYKVDKGDERLKSLLMPYLNQQVALRNGQPTGGSSPDNTQQYLQYAALIASLFA